jgi:AcrR family transcriptional regulator
MAESESRRKRTGKPKRGRPAGRDSETTRAEILRAARVVFGVRGRSAASVRMVAETAGLSVTGVYYHFGSLDEIYGEVVADTAGVLEACMRDVLAQRTLRAQIRAFIFAMHQLDVQDRSILGFMIRNHLDAVRSAGVGGGSGPLTVATEHFFVMMVRAAINRGELPPGTDVRAAVGLLASILWGVGLYSGFVEEADAMAAISNRVDEMFANGLPRPGSSHSPSYLAG